MTKIIEDGQCFKEFLELIRAKHGDASAAKTRECAIRVVRKCIEHYSARFGNGDVGHKGTGRVSQPFAPTTTEPIPLKTNGLLYGRVQSGKTHASIATVALAYENGFRCFILFTSNNVWLADQTYREFRAKLGESGPIVKKWDFWRKDPAGAAKEIKETIFETGVVLVCPKEVHHLENLIEFLKKAGVKTIPGLILDDEADNASLNTQAAKQAREGKKTFDDPSRIFDKIAKIRQVLGNHIFLQVTATPQSLLLQGLEHPSRPVFCEISPMGDGYMGGNIFFRDNSLHSVEVSADELDELKSGAIDPGRNHILPTGLRLALCCFIMGSAYKRKMSQEREIYSFLAHLCHKRINHESLVARLRAFLTEFDQALNGKRTQARQIEAEGWLKDAWDELSTTAPKLPGFSELLPAAKRMLRHVEPEMINADNPNREPDYQPGLNILVGGNRLGRGVTIKGLMTTYYGRDAKQKMMDTVHQHARMFGYRQPLRDVTRLFTAPQILGAFRMIHTANEAMLDAIGVDPDNLELKPVWVGRPLEATRANVLNASEIGAIRSPRLWPKDPMYKKSETHEHTKQLDALLSRYAVDDDYYLVDLDEFSRILKLIPGHDSVWNWQYARVHEILECLKGPPFNLEKGLLNVRRGTNGQGLRISRKPPEKMDYIQGTWATKAIEKDPTAPTLIIMKQKGEKTNAGDQWDGVPFYVSTLLLPQGNPYVFMFNIGEDKE